MQKAPQKPEKSSQNVKVPDKLAKKGSTKEILVLISEDQRKHAETLGKLEVTVAKLEQEFKDYKEHHKSNEVKEESTKQQSQSNLKWIVGLIVSSSLAVAGLMWGMLH
ncbi:MAG: hypothetical protein WC365_09580 [Candidatus Babeliales bacterium]|jgi:hypothetical protein